jgi:hypothetical protein
MLATSSLLTLPRKVWHNVFSEEELRNIVKYAKENHSPLSKANLKSSTFPSFSISSEYKLEILLRSRY